MKLSERQRKLNKSTEQCRFCEFKVFNFFKIESVYQLAFLNRAGKQEYIAVYFVIQYTRQIRRSPLGDRRLFYHRCVQNIFDF